MKISRNDRKDEDRKERKTSITDSLGFAAIALFLPALRARKKIAFWDCTDLEMITPIFLSVKSMFFICEINLMPF